MERISKVINEIYRKYLPVAEKKGVLLDLDFPDPTIKIAKLEEIRKDLEQNVRDALKRANGGKVKIQVLKNKIIISDENVMLPKDVCINLTNDHIIVKSRVGFGTTTTIKFQD